MPRTTLNLDAAILKDLKRLQTREGKPLGRLVSDLLAQALGRVSARETTAVGFEWVSRPLGAGVDLADKEAIRGITRR